MQETSRVAISVLTVQIGDAGIVERPKGLAGRAVNQVAGAAGVEVVKNYGAFRDRLRVGANIEEFLAVMGSARSVSAGPAIFFTAPRLRRFYRRR